MLCVGLLILIYIIIIIKIIIIIYLFDLEDNSSFILVTLIMSFFSSCNRNFAKWRGVHRISW